jgi:hypothetical protein
VIRLLAKFEPLRTSSSISGAKAKNLTLRDPIDEQFAWRSRPQPSVLYHTNTNSLDRQNDQIEASCGDEPIQPMKGTGE